MNKQIFTKIENPDRIQTSILEQIVWPEQESSCPLKMVACH